MQILLSTTCYSPVGAVGVGEAVGIGVGRMVGVGVSGGTGVGAGDPRRERDWAGWGGVWGFGGWGLGLRTRRFLG